MKKRNRILSLLLTVALLAVCVGGFSSIGVAAAEQKTVFSARDSLFPDYSAGDWTHFSRNVITGVNTPMTWDAANARYAIDNSDVNVINDWQTTGDDGAVWSMRVFKAPYSGTIELTMDLNVVGVTNWYAGSYPADISRVYAKVLHNFTEKWAADFSQATKNETNPDGRGYEVAFNKMTLTVAEGDELEFLTGSDSGNAIVWIVPTVSYTSIGGATVATTTAAATTTTAAAPTTTSKATIDPKDKKYASETGFSKDASSIWSYYARNVATSTNIAMEYDPRNIYIAGSGNYISDTWMSTGADSDVWSMRVFTAPYNGTIELTMKDNVVAIADMTAGGFFSDRDSTFAEVRLNYTEKWKANFSGTTLKAPPDGHGYEVPFAKMTLTVKKGDTLQFLAGGNSGANGSVWFSPIIQYTDITDTDGTPPTGIDSPVLLLTLFAGTAVCFAVVLTVAKKRRADAK